jgi:asparagine synthase (glutamine-hydrolysing)
MCGIAGYINFDAHKQADPARLKKMTDCIAYRGPDGEGFFVENNLALGHRRLSIIDLSTGDQPMLSDDGNKVLVFNGEIYNYIELREELKQLGHSFKTNSDTEVLIKSYEQWGYDCQNKFNGMWAFALWDKNKEELFLSSDRIGEKPLHYAVYDNSFIFGSEIKCVFNFGLPKEIRSELIEIYLTLTNIPAPDTFYKHIFKLMPGHYLIVKDGAVTEKAYWKFPQVDEKNMIRDKELVYKTFETLFTDAVKIRMRSDVPFGAFLSGGLDSSSVVAVMAKNSTHPVNTFTIGFDDKAFDESALAAMVAKKFKTEHHRGTVTPDSFEEALKRVSHHYDEPFGDSSAIPTDFVSRYAAQKVKMVLTGDGGDEALSGYNSYKGVKISGSINTYMPFPIKRIIIATVDLFARVFKGALRYRLNKVSSVLKTSNLPFAKRLAEKSAYTELTDIKKLCAGLKNVIPVEKYFERLLADCTFKDDFYKLMYIDYLHNLPNDFLVKVDRMSMANSLETRLPFLDYRLIEFMATVHKDVKMQGLEAKSVLRKTIGKQLPSELLSAPKRGFGIPLREWFKDKEFNRLLQSNLERVSGILDRSVIAKLVQQNNSGEKDNGNFIWTMVELDRVLLDIEKSLTRLRNKGIGICNQP